MKKTILLTCWVILISFIGKSQPEPAFVNYDVQHGLPSSEVYDALEDENGYMWFATDRGVVRFDGYEFELYNQDRGLSDNVVFNLYRDFKNRIWMLPYNRQICYLEDGKIKEYKYNHILKKHLSRRLNYFFSIYLDQDENLFLGTNCDGLLKIDQKGKISSLSDHNRESIQGILQVDNQYLTYRNTTERGLHTNDVYFNEQKIQASERPGIRLNCEALNPTLICYSLLKDVVIYDIDGQQVLHRIPFSERITSLTRIGQQLFVGIQHEGLYIFDIVQGTLHLNLHTLKGKTPAGKVTRDKDGGYWVATTEHGIFYTPNLEVRNLDVTNGLHRNYIKEIRRSGEQLLINYGDHIDRWDGNRVSVETTSLDIESGSVNKYFDVREENCHIYSGLKKVINVCSKTIYPYKRSTGTTGVRQFGKSWLIFHKSCYSLFKNGKSSLHFLDPAIGQVEDVLILDTNHFLIGAHNGLFELNGKHLKRFATEHQSLGSRIVRLVRSSKHGIICATRGNGMLLLKKGKLRQIGKKEGLISNDLTDLFVDQDHHIWIASNLGLQKIDANDFQKIDYYSSKDGFISNEITSIEMIGNRLYAATKRGLSIVDLHHFHPKKHDSHIKITRVALNGKETGSKIINVYPEDHYLDLSFLSINYAAPHQVEYRYQIGDHEEWHYTREQKIKIENFPEAGTYFIRIFARNLPDGDWSPLPAVAQLIVHPPFYQTWTFRIAIVTIIILIIYGGFKLKLFRYDRHVQQELLNRILKKMGRKSYLIISINKKRIRIDQSKIKYIQSFKDYCEIHTEGEKYLHRSTMKKMEEQLPSFAFIRVHRSFLVRKDKIDAISRDHLIIEQTNIPIGKTYREDLKHLENQFSRMNL
ncbi:MAG: hypothetical protein EP338_14210 [Bacteroidetes bacterium]|nr:MAG: hypothetical protein EP338_14210 [Bacteroidota bacterium]